MVETSSGTVESYILKIYSLWMIEDTSQEDEKTLEFVREKEQNLKFVQIKTKSRQQNEKVVLEEEDDSLISMKTE